MFGILFFIFASCEPFYAGFRLACRSPLCRFAAWSSLAVSVLQLSAATPLWLYHRAASLPSWIEFNCLRSAAVSKAARLSINWLDAACRLVIPLRQVALAQLYKYHHQSGNAASGKLVWKQHKEDNRVQFFLDHSQRGKRNIFSGGGKVLCSYSYLVPFQI